MIQSTTCRESDHVVKGLFVKRFFPTEHAPFDAPVVMVHGGSHGWWAFEEWLPLFAACGWSSSALSLRNHTGSYSVPQEAYLKLTVLDYVADVRDVLDWIGKPSILVGHSMGGIVAQKAAECGQVKALVLVAAVGPGQLGPLRDPLPVNKPVFLDREMVRKNWFYAIDPTKFNAIYERMVPESPSVINEYSTGKVLVEREKIQCPVLVLRGACDRSAVHEPQAIASFYQAPFRIEPDCGHDLMLEPMAEGVAEGIHHWLLSVL